jgi:hypothetical protein
MQLRVMPQPSEHEDYRKERDHHQAAHKHEVDPSYPERENSILRKIIAGGLLGSFLYLVVSCYYAADLHESKVARAKSGFTSDINPTTLKERTD